MSPSRFSLTHEPDRLTQGGGDSPRLRGDIRDARSAETALLPIAHIDDRYTRRRSLGEPTGRVAQDRRSEAQEAPVSGHTEPIHEDDIVAAAGPLAPVVLNHDSAGVRVRLRHDV